MRNNKKCKEKNCNKQPMSGAGNREVPPGVISDWKTIVEMICGKGVF